MGIAPVRNCWNRCATDERDVLRVRSLRDRLQIGVDVGEIAVGEDLLAIGGHRAIGHAHKARQCVERKRIGSEPWPGHGSLSHRAVALPASNSHKDVFAVLHRCREGPGLREEEPGGERRQSHAYAIAPHRGWVHTSTSAGSPALTTSTARFSAPASSLGSLIGPADHQPNDAASFA